MNALQRRLFINNSSDKNTPLLPPEYQRVEWIESDGINTYINTNYASSADDKPLTIEIEFQLSTLIGGDMMGVMDSDNRFPLALSVYGSIGKWLFYHYGDATKFNTGARFGAIDLNWHTMRYVFGEGVYLDGVLMPETVEQAKISSNSNSPLFLFASNRGGIAKSHKKMRMYRAKFGEPNILVRDYVPCYRKSDGVVGMYDLCGSICPLIGTPFYINAGTGEFLKGADV